MPRRSGTPERLTRNGGDGGFVACPMMWREQKLAKVVSCLGVAPIAAERLASMRVAGMQSLAQMTNAQMSQDLGLVAPLERLVVRRALHHLLEADRYANSSRGRCMRDVMENPGLRSCIIPFERLKLTSLITQGGFGMVYKGELEVPSGGSLGSKAGPVAPDTGQTKQVVAVKEMLGDHRVRLYELLKEAQVMQSLKHPNICRFIGVLTDGKPKGRRYIVSELLHGSLFDLVHTPMTIAFTTVFGPTLALRLGEGICAGLAYLHGRDLVHADLKSSNILVDLTDRSAPVPRICDFGHAAVRIGASPHDRLCTPHWAAPEILRGEGLGPAADVFSVGVLLWEMLSKKVPHEELTFGQVLASVGWAGATPEVEALPVGLPESLLRLVGSLLRFIPSERPSAAVARRRMQRLPQSVKRRATHKLAAFLGCFG